MPLKSETDMMSAGADGRLTRQEGWWEEGGNEDLGPQIWGSTASRKQKRTPEEETCSTGHVVACRRNGCAQCWGPKAEMRAITIQRSIRAPDVPTSNGKGTAEATPSKSMTGDIVVLRVCCGRDCD